MNKVNQIDADSIFYKIDKRNYDDSCCFLCGEELNDSNRSDEHVIPKWLQEKYNLWNQELGLINGTNIKYRQLTIPCCSDCNTKYLSSLETRVSQAESKGYQEFCKLNKMDLFYWLGKIYYGLMYKEMFLLKNRKNPDEGTILNKEYVELFRAHYMFLMGIRGGHSCENFFPASIFIVNTQKPKKLEYQWDFYDKHFKMFIAMRFGEIGLVANLQDMEAVKESIKLDDFYMFELHPYQFIEMSAVVFNTYLRMNRTPKFISYEDTNNDDKIIRTSMVPLQGLSSKPVFENWSDEMFAEVLAGIMGMPYEYINPEPGKFRSFIYDENHKPIFIPIKEDL
ncbi:hypothetical protein M0P98_09385 [bacterium]|nr:hypothetical protein [bacterium]